MNVTEIPFVKKAGITRTDDNTLGLTFTEDNYNHLQTIHAGAQYTLAETASGELLQSAFPDLVGKVIPVLREANVKYKQPAVKDIIAYATITDEAREKFSTQFTNKGRGSILVNVDIKDADGTLTCVAGYSWFVQKL